MKWFKSLYNASWSKVPTLQTYNNDIKGTEQSQTNVREECKSKWNLTPFAAYLIAIIIHILPTPHYIKVAKDRHRVGNGNSREQDHEDGSEDAADTPYLSVSTAVKEHETVGTARTDQKEDTKSHVYESCILQWRTSQSSTQSCGI